MTEKTAIKWTAEQRLAIETIGRNVLVSAAAGSGKTAVLAERCAHLLCHHGCSVDQLLVVTFTEAAASEMRVRIAQSLRRRLGTSRAGRWAQRQLTLLDGAQISTMHAFCRTIIRDHFTEAGVDPGSAIADASEAALLQRETIEALFDELYGLSDDELAVGFRRLVDDYGLGSDEPIADFVIRLHAFVHSLPDSHAWLMEAARRVDPNSPDGIDVAAVRRGQLVRELEAFVADAARLACSVRETSRRWARYADAMDQDQAAVQSWLETLRTSGSSDAVNAVMDEVNAFKFSPAPRVPAAERDEDPAGKDRAHALLNGLRDRIKRRVRPKLCSFSLDELREGLAAITPYTRTLVDLTNVFTDRYDARKRENALLDFNDLERLAFNVLAAKDDRTSPSDAARTLRARFVHVLVDEVQDISPLQDAILRLVSREDGGDGSGNLFAVGDIKQSIYRFRLAEPTILADRIGAYGTDSDDGKELLYLRNNFRSRAHVLDAINALFARLMSHEFAGIDYDTNARLVHPDPSDDPAPQGPTVECHVLAKGPVPGGGDESPASEDDSPADWEAIEREALLIGRCISALTGTDGRSAPMRIKERAGDPAAPPRKITCRDIVILLRAPRRKTDALLRVLRRMGVPAYADAGGGYFETVEVRDVLSLLDVLDNRQQDIPLAAVLRSPVLGPGDGLSDADLVTIRGIDRGIPFHEAVVKYACAGESDSLRARLTEKLQAVDDYRTAAGRQPLADVLWRIFEETGYLSYVSGLPGGLQRRANLLKLHERARQFGRFARQGLHRFLRFIEQLTKEGHDFGVAPTVSEADDVVRIMSIHKAKGLEFPVVILADLGKQWNRGDARGDMIHERGAKIGLRVVDPDHGIKYPSIAHQLVAEEIERESMAEELRLLYVALTRARERLILVGTADLDKVEQVRQSPTTDGPLPATTLASANSPLDWIIHALAAQPKGNVTWSASGGGTPPLFAVCRHTADDISAWSMPEEVAAQRRSAFASYAALAPLSDGEPVADDETVERVIARMTAVYDAAGMTTVPAVVAASEMKRRFDLLREPDDRRRSLVEAATKWERPAFLEGVATAGAGGAERGTATHLILEHLDLSRSCSADGLRRQIDEMVAAGVLAAVEAEMVPLDAVAWFLDSDLGRRMREEPGAVQREVMFVTRVEPQQYDSGLEPIDARDTILVRGIIDCLIHAPDGLEIIDYKTDDVTAAQVPDRAAAYVRQLEMYARAVGAIWKRPVIAKRLVFLTPRVIQNVA